MKTKLYPYLFISFFVLLGNLTLQAQTTDSTQLAKRVRTSSLKSTTSLMSTSSVMNLAVTGNVATLATTLPSSYQYYVSKNGSDANAGSQSAPFATIQKAINTATNGQAIKVAAGRYAEHLNFNGKSLKLVGDVDNPSTTIIDATSTGHVIIMNSGETSSTLVCGFTLTNGIAVTSSSAFDTDKGGAIYLFNNAAPVLSHLIITNNNGTNGGAIAVLHSASPTLENVLIYNNKAAYGSAIYMYNSTSVSMTNVTIVANSSVSGGALFLYRGATTSITNSIIVNNESKFEIQFCASPNYNADCTASLTYSNVRGGSITNIDKGTSGYTMTLNWGTGCISTDPLFVNYTSKQFKLLSTSPCIDAGDATSIYNDLYSPPGQKTTRNDMGFTGGSNWKDDANIIVNLSLGSKNQNYVQTIIPQVVATTDNALLGLANNQVLNSIQYFDGLGRPMQTVQVGTSPSQKDIIQPIVYDKFGRESVKYLPYSGTSNNGSYRSNAILVNNAANTYTSSEQYAFYHSSTNNVAQDNYPYAQTVYEASPLNRVLQQGAPGADWQPSNSAIPNSGHTQKIDYLTNVANEVKLFSITNNNELKASGYYAPSQLFVTRFLDENGNETIEYKDKEGRVILKHSQNQPYGNQAENLNTYYVYDDFGLLRYVLPPLLYNQLVIGTTYIPSSTLIKQLAYYYEYDARQRMIIKQLPGADPVYMVYDKRDRLVLSQDGVQRKNNQWLFTKYDVLNRPVLTGMFDTTVLITLSVMQTNAESFTGTKLYEERGSSVLGYTNRSFPWVKDPAKYLSATYYDSYDFPGAQAFDNTANNIAVKIDGATPLTSNSTQTVGLVTGTKTKVLGTTTFLTSTNYYDDRYRVIQTQRQLYDGTTTGEETVSNKLDFTGKVKQTRQIQIFNTKSTMVDKFFIYDHAGRLLKTDLQINGDNTNKKITVSELAYNELGQLIDKKLHKKADDATATYMQSIDYAYNIRGWLTSINNPDNLSGGTGDPAADLFAERLSYNTTESGLANTPQYNGNISSQVWNNNRDKQGYIYSYDNLNRLLKGDYKTYGTTWTDATKYEETIGLYDYNGNIKSLTRTDNAGLTSGTNGAAYTYTYNGNQLTNINNGTAYTYDPNGNMLTDGRTGNAVTYNLLNLPASVAKTVSTTTDKIAYTYNAGGEKLQKTYTQGTAAATNQYYAGNMVYSNNKDLDYIIFDEGVIKKTTSNGTSNYSYEYNIKDHLGNTRIVFSTTGTSPKIEQTTDYYPFGQSFYVANATNNQNKYLYNGKEQQQDVLGGSSLNWYDYGARFYDPQIGRFTTPDPLCEVNRRWSSYRYAYDNPLRFIDPDGMLEDDYFNEKGNYLGTDNAKTDNVKVTSQTNWDAAKTIDENGTETIDHDMGNAISVDHSKSGISNDASLAIYEHYNTTDCPISEPGQRNPRVENGKGGMAFKYSKGGAEEIVIKIEGNKRTGIADHANEIRNSFAHEDKHNNDFQEKGYNDYKATPPEQRERRAIGYQMQQNSYKDSRSDFQKSVIDYGTQNGMLFPITPIKPVVTQ